MIRKVFIFLLIAINCSFIAGSQPLSTIIKTQAIEMGKALLRKDIPVFQKYMHPKVIEAAGGAEKLSTMMDTAFKVLQQFGGTIKKITYGNPAGIIRYKKELQTTLPQTTEVTTSIADFIASSTLVALSADNGKNWYFIDPSLFRSPELKKQMPALSPELVIPPPAKPQIIPKDQKNG